MKSRDKSTKSQKMTGSFQSRSAVENKKHITTFTDFLNFLHTYRYFLEQIYQYEDIEKTGLGSIKGKVLLTKKAEFAKNNPTLPGLDQVEKYLKFVTLPIEDENGNEIEDADRTVTIDKKNNPSEGGKPLIGVDIYKWIADHHGLADNSTHSKNITYKTQNEGYQIARGQHTRAGLIEKQPKFAQAIQQAKLDNALMGAFFTDSHSQVNVRGTNFSYLNLRYSNFNYALAEDTQWNGTDAQYADFSNILLKGANLSHASFCNADFRNARIYGDAKNHTEALGADFSFADMRHMKASMLVAKNAIFKNTNAEEIELHGADLENADFSYAILKKAKIYRSSEDKTNITNANFSYADVSEADFDGTDCINANFAFAIAHKINFINSISLKGSSFEEANLTEAKIFSSKKGTTDPKHTNFSNTNFRNANLTDSNLGYIDFSGATLAGANLTNALLHNIFFTNADLLGVNFKNAAIGYMVDIMPKQLAKAINIDKIRHYSVQDNKRIYTTYDELCKLGNKQLLLSQKILKNLITEALNIQKSEKKNIQTTNLESEQKTQQEQSKKEDVVVIKEGKQEINIEKSMSDNKENENKEYSVMQTNKDENKSNQNIETNSNSNVALTNNNSDGAVKRLSRKTKKKMKQKTVSEKITPEVTEAATTQTEPKVQSLAQHGVCSRNAADQNTILESEQKTQQEQSKKEDVVVIKEGKQEINIEKSMSENKENENKEYSVMQPNKDENKLNETVETNSNSNVALTKNNSGGAVKRLSRKTKKKMKQKAVSEKITPEVTEAATIQTEPKVQSLAQHGIFSRNVAGEHFMQRYQNTIKGICVTLLGLGCLWAMNFISQQSEDEHPKNMTNFSI